MQASFIVKHEGNGNFSTLTMLCTVKTDSNGIARYFYFWQKSNESRTRYIGEFGQHDYYQKALAHICDRTESTFVGWLTPGMPDPPSVDIRDPNGIAI